MHELSGKEFQIGLTMSGAISAGAYTAGVVDFLIEALEAWEEARKGPASETVPNHRVGIKVMSGASAGAITAAIGAIALADGERLSEPFISGGYTYRYTLSKLYESWVVRPTLVSDNPDVTDFLSLGDLDAQPEAAEHDFSRSSTISSANKNDPIFVVSLLNARLLDEIANDAISVSRLRPVPLPYISKTLHVYLTLSNLRGVPWRVPFDGGDYHMISHGDRVHYALTGIGSWDTASAFADEDQKRSLDIGTITSAEVLARDKWKDYAICALGSSAFPVGLAPRLIGARLGTVVQENEYAGRRFPNDDLARFSNIDPNWPKAVLNHTPFWFTCADGGIIDNDPFEYARFTLKEQGRGERINWELSKVDRAVIMISPFPEEKPILGEGEPATDIVSLFSSLMPALIDQARFKPSELALAADPTHGSRYLIGPRRVENGKLQRYGIASGLLGGFGGFVARAFRDHDYQLGRQNCQTFLATNFALPADNDIINSWPALVERTNFEALRDPNAKPPEPSAYQLIPLFGAAKEPLRLPAWPQISQAEFDALQERIAKRFDRVAPMLLQQNVRGVLGFLLGLVLKPGVRSVPGLVRDKALNFVRLTILADLVRRNQIVGWDLPDDLDVDPDDARLVVAELLNPRYDERNIQGVRKAVSSVSGNLDSAGIEAVLTRLKQARGKPYEVWEAPWKDKAGGRLFTLASRKPNLLDGVLGGRLGVGFFKPVVDSPGL